MDTNNSKPTHVGEPATDGGNWRSQLQNQRRKRVVNKITDTLKRYFPSCGQEDLQEIKNLAVRFEEKVYTTATSQFDYLRRITLKMFALETRFPVPKNMQSNSANNGQGLPDQGSRSMQSQLNSQPPPLPIPPPSKNDTISDDPAADP